MAPKAKSSALADIHMVAPNSPDSSSFRAMRTQLDYKTIARATIFTSVKALILKGVIPVILTNIQSSRPTTASAQCADILQNITHRFDAHGKFFTDNLQSSKHQHAHPHMTYLYGLSNSSSTGR